MAARDTKPLSAGVVSDSVNLVRCIGVRRSEVDRRDGLLLPEIPNGDAASAIWRREVVSVLGERQGVDGERSCDFFGSKRGDERLRPDVVDLDSR